MACEARAASDSPWPCAWKPLGLPHWGSGQRRGAWQPTPQQACAVRMAGDTPSAVMPLRNVRWRPYRRATTVMPGGSAGGPVVRPTAWTQGVHRKVRCRYGCKAAAEAWSPVHRGAAGIGGSRRDRRACSRAGKLDAGGRVATPIGCLSAVRCCAETAVGCSSGEGMVWWQALDAQRRRLPHWGCEKRRRAHPARKEPATRRPVRWPP